MNQGKFIVLEGIDGAGTTTQSKAVCQALNKLCDIQTLWTHEPTDRPIGAFIRQILQKNIPFDGHGAWMPPDEAMALLFSADRVDHIQNFIEPNLETCNVISDRYVHSTLSYQALTSKHSLEEYSYWLQIVNNFIIIPDLTIILRVSAEEAARRRKARGEAKDIYEENDLQVKLVDFYDKFPSMKLGNIKIIDGEKSKTKVLNDCMDLVLSIME
jgi:dTMP kinase